MKNKKLLPLFGSGVVSLIGGGVFFYVEQRLSILAAGLCLWGVVVLAFCLTARVRSSQRHMTGSQWRKLGVLLLTFVLSSAFLIGANYLVARLPWRWDVTRAKQHTLSPNTIKFIQGIKQDVKFTALYVGLPPTYLVDLFKEYERASNGRIKTEIVDPIEQIGYAAQFGNVINGKEKKVVVASGKERRDVDFTSSPLSEDQLTNAVVRVTRQKRRVYFLTGHGEYSVMDKSDPGLTMFSKMLADNNIFSKEIMMGITPKIPRDCDVLVVAGPHNELTGKEEAAIEQYLRQGGKALFLIENIVVTTPDKPLTADELHKNPSLNAIFNQWGVNIGDDIVVDLDSHAGDDVGCPATRNYGTQNVIAEGLDYTFYIRPRSIKVLKDRRPSLKLAPLVMTGSGDKTWAVTDRTLKVRFDPDRDTMGPVAIAFAIMEKKKAAGAMSDTRIIVFTDADFLTNAYIDQYSNGRMGLNVINWLSESDGRVFVDPKNIKVERLDLTSKQKREVAAILFLMPVLITAFGIIVWVKR
jgi:ABC-type uncharacterized transport system involved in gliding motility auxiliary subunit